MLSIFTKQMFRLNLILGPMSRGIESASYCLLGNMAYTNRQLSQQPSLKKPSKTKKQTRPNMTLLPAKATWVNEINLHDFLFLTTQFSPCTLINSFL